MASFRKVLLLGMFLAPECEGTGLRNSEVTSGDAETSLATELAGNVNASRLAEIESQLRPTYAALPKGPGGQLGHQAVRYVLHRLFVQRHSWYVRGLEPGDDAKPVYLQEGWVPAHLQGILESRLDGHHGINLQELAALAAAIEDLVHNEAMAHIEEVYALHGFPTHGHRITSVDVKEAVSTYMMLYLKDGKFNSVFAGEVDREKDTFKQTYADWGVLERWFNEVADKHIQASETGGLDFDHVKRVVADLSEGFGTFNDKECRDLKKTMLEMEVGQTGRVRLADFYGKSLHSHWEFNEKADYLRSIGALDEVSDPAQPRVLVPNYLSSRGNCLESSSLYAVCCRNECEDLIGKLEVDVAQPTASVGRIMELVQALPSDTVTAPRVLSPTMQRRLNEVAAQNDGRVPLHGRLFAQWMHHAYPRECPYPHAAGAANPQTPEEWMQEAGSVDARASEEEIRAHIESAPPALHDNDEEIAALHWSDEEELFAVHPTMRWKRHVEEEPSRTSGWPLLVIGVVLLVIATLPSTFYISRANALLTCGFCLLACFSSKFKPRPTTFADLSIADAIKGRPGTFAQDLSLPAPCADAMGPSRKRKAKPHAVQLVVGSLGVVCLIGAVDAFGLLHRAAFGGALALCVLTLLFNKVAPKMITPVAKQMKICKEV